MCPFRDTGFDRVERCWAGAAPSPFYPVATKLECALERSCWRRVARARTRAIAVARRRPPCARQHVHQVGHYYYALRQAASPARARAADRRPVQARGRERSRRRTAMADVMRQTSLPAAAHAQGHASEELVFRARSARAPWTQGLPPLQLELPRPSNEVREARQIVVDSNDVRHGGHTSPGACRASTRAALTSVGHPTWTELAWEVLRLTRLQALPISPCTVRCLPDSAPATSSSLLVMPQLFLRSGSRTARHWPSSYPDCQATEDNGA